MKAIMIIYNQALSEKVELLFDHLNIRGFSRMENVQGRGSENGNPRMGTHTWPEMNSATITVVDEEQVSQVLKDIKKINAINEEVGIRAFVWEITETV